MNGGLVFIQAAFPGVRSYFSSFLVQGNGANGPWEAFESRLQPMARRRGVFQRAR
jgi:hypothetical protein